jgi:hypothetical protein
VLLAARRCHDQNYIRQDNLAVDRKFWLQRSFFGTMVDHRKVIPKGRARQITV